MYLTIIENNSGLWVYGERETDRQRWTKTVRDLYMHARERETERNRKTERQRDRQIDRQAGKDRQRQIETNKVSMREKER